MKTETHGIRRGAEDRIGEAFCAVGGAFLAVAVAGVAAGDPGGFARDIAALVGGAVGFYSAHRANRIRRERGE